MEYFVRYLELHFAKDIDDHSAHVEQYYRNMWLWTTPILKNPIGVVNANCT